MENQDRFEQLEKRVRVLEEQLAKMQQVQAPVSENAVKNQSPLIPKPKTGEPGTEQPGIKQPKTELPKTELPKTELPKTELPAKNARPVQDWEQIIAKVWLPRIFVIVLLLGVLWGFIAAVNAGWITESVRCMLGIAAAGFLFWQGEKQARLKHRTLGQVLCGGAVALLMISLFAAHMLYGLIPHVLAFILYILSVSLGVYAAARHRSQTLMIIAMMGGYLVPFLVDSPDQHVSLFVFYETLFSIVMMWLSVRYQYRVSFYVAIGLLHAPLLIGYWTGHWNDHKTPFLLAVSLQHAALFGFCTSPKSRPACHPGILFAGFGLLAAWMYGLYGHSLPDGTRMFTPYSVIILLWSLIYSIAALSSIRRKQTAAAVHLSIATFGWFLWLTYLANGHYATAIWIVQGALAITLGIKLASKMQQASGWIIYGFGIIALISEPIPNILSPEALAWTALLLSLGGLYVLVRKITGESLFDMYRILTAWGFAIALLAFVTQITNLATESATEDWRHLILSAVWVVYAIGVIAFGLIGNVRKARIAGVLFLFFILLKIIFVDLPDVTITIRAILFIGLGGIGLLVSRLFYKSKKDA